MTPTDLTTEETARLFEVIAGGSGAEICRYVEDLLAATARGVRGERRNADSALTALGLADEWERRASVPPPYPADWRDDQPHPADATLSAAINASGVLRECAAELRKALS